MGGSSKSQKQTTTNAPPAWAAPLFQQSASEAQKLYNSGSGGNVYQGETVAQFSPESMGGINALTTAGQNAPNYNGLMGQASGPTSAGQNLQGMASGEYLKSGNPYFNEALQGQLDSTAAQVQSQFSGAGRYGSGANTGALTNSLGNIRSSALYNQFNQDSQNMLSANSQIDSSRSRSLMDQLGIGQAGYQNQLSGAGAQVEAGRMLDDKTQQNLLADYSKWTAEDMQDWTRLGLLQSAAAGSAGNYGTSVQTATQPTNYLGIAGGLGSLFGKSDARLKEAYEPVGVENGHIIWEFAYKGSPDRYRGVMAQMVEDIDPDAVVMEADGFYAVDYARLGLEMVRVL